MVVLRDGKKIIGTMRSFDQFANVVLEHAFERVIVGKKFADVPLGLYVIRGENVVLLGQIVRRLCRGRAARTRCRSPRTCNFGELHTLSKPRLCTGCGSSGAAPTPPAPAPSRTFLCSS